MSQAYRETARRHPAQQQGLLSRGLAGLSKLAFWLFAAWLFSILAEWVGMWLWWPEEGVNHSRWMLEREIGYVHRDFAQSLLVEQPAAYVRTFAEVSYYYLFQVTGIERFGLWLHQPPDPEGYRVQMLLRGLFAHVAEHVIAAVNITQVFALRLGVLTLAMPVFVLFGSVAVVDGLVQRDLRRWGGGRESSFLYHHAKRLVWPSIVMAWVVYLATPVSVHPNFVILPFAVLSAIAIAVTASTFKKYL
jgi:integrating conjugative element membrane protein (TIGR03747 family)